MPQAKIAEYRREADEARVPAQVPQEAVDGSVSAHHGRRLDSVRAEGSSRSEQRVGAAPRDRRRRWYRNLGWKEILAIELVGSALGWAAVGYPDRWSDPTGAIIGALVAALATAFVKTGRLLASYADRVDAGLLQTEELTGKSEQLLERIARTALSPTVVSSLVNESPFTGVLGTLYARSRGNPFIEDLSWDEYLDLLTQAVRSTQDSYFTIQPSGLVQFQRDPSRTRSNSSLRFLEAFAERMIPSAIRVLLVDDEQTIATEEADEDLLSWYWNRVGESMETYWVARAALTSAEARQEVREPGDPFPSDRVSHLQHADVVVCDRKLLFRYDSANCRLDFWHSPAGEAFPYRWVYESVKQASPIFKPLKHPQHWIETRQLRFRDSKGVVVDLRAVRENLETIRSLHRGSRIMAVLKSDAYGLGLERIARSLLELGVDAFGVSTIAEAAAVRQLDQDCRVLLMEGVSLLDVRFAVAYGVDTFVWSEEVVRALDREAREQGCRARVHVKVDTGMSRLGIAASEVEDFVQMVCSLPGVELAAVASHLALAEDPDAPITRSQLDCFEQVVQAVRGASGPGQQPEAHLANTMGFLQGSALQYDFARVGGALFGVLPNPPKHAVDLHGMRLRGAVTVLGRVIQVRTIRRGDGVSYGGQPYELHDEGTLAVVNIGYGDGVPPIYDRAGRVLVRGHLCPVVGKVCLGMTIVDVTDVPGVSANDQVVFVGRQGTREILAEEAAEWGDCTPYGILHGFGRLLHRSYLEQSEPKL